ncbi:MAG: aldose epimerase [Acidimicrobiales bacterium]
MRAGELFEVGIGHRRAIVSEQGASLVQVRWDGVELLSTVTDDGFAGPGAHGQLLVPWPGRVAKGSYEYEGSRYQLPVDDPATSAAIHGLVRWASWQPKDHGPGRLTLGHRLLATPGYPFPLELEQSYAWTGDQLEISFSARNIGARTAPFGYGCHPYFSVGSPTVDDDILRVPANCYVPGDEDLNAAGPLRPVDGTSFDFRQARPISRAKLDLTLADLDRDGEGAVAVSFRAPGSGPSITCRYEHPIRYVQLYSGDTLPEGRRQGLAIEPYTCVPNAFNNGVGLIHLAAGGTVRARWALSARL